MYKVAKSGADVQYLSSAIVQEGLKQKFKSLFGRDPVARTETDPMKVVDARIPDIIAETINSDIAKVLKTTAIESTENTSGELPEINNATLLYTILEDTPIKITLEGIPEFLELQDNVEPVLTAINDTTGISVQEGTAYLPAEYSAITVGIFVDNKLFGAEFQYRLSNAGGNEIEGEKKKEVFDNLYSELPGGDQKTEENVKQDLLKVVGLNEYVTQESTPPPEKQAPGPEAKTTPEVTPEATPEVAQESAPKTFSLREFTQGFIKENGYGFEKYSRSLRQLIDVSNDDIDEAEKEYIMYASKSPIFSTLLKNYSIENGTVVTSSKYPKKVFTVVDIFGDVATPDVLVEDASTGRQHIEDVNNLSIY